MLWKMVGSHANCMLFVVNRVKHANTMACMVFLHVISCLESHCKESLLVKMTQREKSWTEREKRLSERHGAFAGVHREYYSFWVISLTHNTLCTTAQDLVMNAGTDI